jgi:hypothetical protein
MQELGHSDVTTTMIRSNVFRERDAAYGVGSRRSAADGEEEDTAIGMLNGRSRRGGPRGGGNSGREVFRQGDSLGFTLFDRMVCCADAEDARTGASPA